MVDTEFFDVHAVDTPANDDRPMICSAGLERRDYDTLIAAVEGLDVDADTGGYNLQAAFSTGWLAGRSAASAVDRGPEI